MALEDEPAIFHIVGRDEWDDSRPYAPASLDEVGFVHCSSAEQVTGVADAVYAGRDDLLLVCVDPQDVDVRWEGDPSFPHVYGPLEPSAMLGVVELRAANDGFVFPEGAADAARRPPRSIEELRDQILALMDGFPAPWWVGGGWAIDVWLGRQTREHRDVDLVVLTQDQAAIRHHFEGWEFRLARTGGSFERWDGVPVELPFHQFWARRRPAPDVVEPFVFCADPTFVEFLLEQSDEDVWVYRRNPSIRAPMDRFGTFAGGLPVVTPEVQLLFKAPGPDYRDNAHDFKVALPELDHDARAWLRSALETAHPGMPWIERL